MGLSPQFSVNISAKEKFTGYVLIVDDKSIDKQVQDLAKRYGKVSQPEISGTDDMLSGEFSQLDKEGNVIEGETKKPSPIYIDRIEDDKTKKSLVGLKKDDVVTIDPKKLNMNADELARLPGIEKKTAEEIKSK